MFSLLFFSYSLLFSLPLCFALYFVVCSSWVFFSLLAVLLFVPSQVYFLFASVLEWRGTEWNHLCLWISFDVFINTMYLLRLLCGMILTDWSPWRTMIYYKMHANNTTHKRGKILNGYYYFFSEQNIWTTRNTESHGMRPKYAFERVFHRVFFSALFFYLFAKNCQLFYYTSTDFTHTEFFLRSFFSIVQRFQSNFFMVCYFQ